MVLPTGWGFASKVRKSPSLAALAARLCLRAFAAASEVSFDGRDGLNSYSGCSCWCISFSSSALRYQY